MANFHDRSLPYIENLTYTSEDIIVEIGSDRGEGSTSWFNDFAKQKNVDFYSVDVTDYASMRFKHLNNTNFEITRSGAEWAKNKLPKIRKNIKVLYLDNYDWLATNVGKKTDGEEKQMREYKTRGVKMSNLDCQREHIAQMYYCLEYMADNSVIICDDTPFQHHSQIYIGKNGAVVPLLLNFGYKIVYGPGLDTPCPDDNGVILVR